MTHQRPIEYAIAILRDSNPNHAELTAVLEWLCDQVETLGSTGLYEGYTEVSAHLDMAAVCLKDAYLADDEHQHQAEIDAERAERRIEARAINKESWL